MTKFILYISELSQEKIQLFLTIDILNILDLDESSSKMSLKLKITLEWKETRVNFLHLQEDDHRNILTIDEMNVLWMPSIIFSNTKHNKELDLSKDPGFGTISLGESKA